MNDDNWTAPSRRRFLAAAASVGITGIAGCGSGGGDGDGDGDGDGNGDETDTDPGDVGDVDVGRIGSGMEGRGIPGGVPMAEMPDLSGSLTLYSGRGEALVGELVSHIENRYDDFDLKVRYGGSTDLVNQILTAGQASKADVFYSVNAGALGALAEKDRTKTLPDAVLSKVPEAFRDDEGQWVGTSGRARTVPYNTNEFSGSDIPDDIFAFPEQDRFDGKMGWAPGYGSFQAFVTAMRIRNGKEQTKQWLKGMLDSGVERFSDEFLVSQAIADGEIKAGFTNHYYIQRVVANNPNAPIATAFTNGDAGAIFNVAGAATVDTANDQTLAGNFVRHLLSAEAQEYFATATFEYPLIPEVEPVGRLPTIDELNPPSDFDLTQLADLGPTIKLMRDVGIQV